MIHLKADKVAGAYREWVRDTRSFVFEVPHGKPGAFAWFLADIPPEAFASPRLTATITRGTHTWSCQAWADVPNGHVILGNYPIPGDTVTLRW